MTQDTPADFVDQALFSLEQAMAALSAEIRAYPTPISGRDAQFNHLLAERTRVSEALRALKRDVLAPTSREPWGVRP
ncbi:MAG: hypothetical protein AAFX03_02720 [Pseudomonadota bacterium]